MRLETLSDSGNLATSFFCSAGHLATSLDNNKLACNATSRPGADSAVDCRFSISRPAISPLPGNE